MSFAEKLFSPASLKVAIATGIAAGVGGIAVAYLADLLAGANATKDSTGTSIFDHLVADTKNIPTTFVRGALAGFAGSLVVTALMK